MKNFADVIDLGAAALGDRDMIVLGDDRQSWNDIQARAGQTANALAADGVGSQDRVAFIDKNSIEYFELAFGAAYLNAVTVAVNWRLAPPEMAYIVNDSQAKVLVIHEEFAEQLAAFEADLTHVERIVVIGSAGDHVSYDEWRDAHESDCERLPLADDDVCTQLYTSGTTGLPKGAQITNANFQALFDTVDWDMDEDSRNLCVMPLFHIAGSGWAQFGMANGATTIMMREFDPVAGLQIVEAEATTHAIFVPAILQFFLMVPSEDVDLSSMQYIAYGASPITEDVLVKSMEQFGCNYFQVYGMTETTGGGTTLPPEDHGGDADPKLLRSAGKPIRGMEMKIVEPETGEEVADGEVGEVWMRHGGVMKGYWNMPEETAKALPGDGWLRSGDLAYMDEDGYFFIQDRTKDMINVSGLKVYSTSVDEVLFKHPGVLMAVAVGVPDPNIPGSERVMAIVRLRDEYKGKVTAEDIINTCKEHLPRYAVPKYVDFKDDLPMTVTEKLFKKEMRDEAVERMKTRGELK